MADIDIVQVIAEARIDARSLSEFVWKPVDFMVQRRLAPPINTLNFYIDKLENYTAGLDVKLTQASTVIDNKVAQASTTVDKKLTQSSVSINKIITDARANAISSTSSIVQIVKEDIDRTLQQAINDAGFVIADSFEIGANITQRNQALRHELDNRLYRWAGDLPKVVAASSTPASTGGFSATAWIEVSDVSLRQQIATEKGFKELTGQMVGHAYGVPAPLIDMQLNAFNVAPADYFDNHFWGTAAGRVYKSLDGVAWVDVCATPTGFLRIIPTSDGEVLGLDTDVLRKSSGWGTDTVTWTAVLTNTTSGSITPFRAWGFDGDGTKFIINHYENSLEQSFANSRYVWISTDSGNTFNIVWDTGTEFPGLEAESHLHAACYDAQIDRFWFAEGHGEMVGLRWSDDNGVTWTRLANDNDLSPAFTVMIPTDFGIVCGTDSAENGIYVMQRANNPETTGVKFFGRWESESDRRGLYGFADRGFRDPDTGIVYVGWASFSPEIPTVIMACGSGGANVVYTAPEGEGGNNLGARFNNIVAAKGVIIGSLETHKDAGNFIAKTSKFTASTRPIDNGNVLTSFGDLTSGSSMRMGVKSIAKGIDGVAIGNGANSGENDNTAYTVALGLNAKTTSTNTIAIGSNAKSLETAGVAIGDSANVTGAFGVAFGKSANAPGDSGVAVGNGALAQSDTVSIGRNANASSAGGDVNSVSIGSYSESKGGGSTAIGFTAKASANFDCAYGAYSNALGANGVAFGAYAKSGTSSVSIGFQAKSESIGSVSIGSESDTTSGAAYNTAIGSKSVANAGESIAFGREAKSTFFGAVAVGASAEALHFNAVAIGRGTKTIRASSVCVGDRDIESTKVGGGMVLIAPNGSKYVIKVDNAGVVTTTAV